MEGIAKLILDHEACKSEVDAWELMNSSNESSAFVSVHDEHGKYLGASDSVFEVTGYESKELEGNSAYDYFHPTDFHAILKSHATVSIRPEIAEVSYRLRKKDNSYVTLTSYSKQLKADNGSEIIVVLSHV